MTSIWEIRLSSPGDNSCIPNDNDAAARNSFCFTVEESRTISGNSDLKNQGNNAVSYPLSFPPHVLYALHHQLLGEALYDHLLETCRFDKYQFSLPPNLSSFDEIYTLKDNMDEQQAIQQLKNGDISGLQFLVARYQVKAVRTAFLITRDPGLAEDIVQDSFLRAFRAMRGFDATRPFEPWFMRSVVNASVKVMQRSAQQVWIGDDADESVFAELAARVESVEAQVESIEVQNQIWDAMQKLSPRQRAVVVERYFLEMSEKEMAEEAGSSVGTVKWMLNAARERLRGLLERSEA